MTSVLHTVIGEVALLAIFLTSLWGIYSPRVNDGILGRALYMVKAMCCLAGFSHLLSDTVPKNILVTLLVCMALHMLRDVLVAHYRLPCRMWWARKQAGVRGQCGKTGK